MLVWLVHTALFLQHSIALCVTKFFIILCVCSKKTANAPGIIRTHTQTAARFAHTHRLQKPAAAAISPRRLAKPHTLPHHI